MGVGRGIKSKETCGKKKEKFDPYSTDDTACFLCRYCFEEDCLLICEQWNKIVDETDICKSYEEKEFNLAEANTFNQNFPEAYMDSSVNELFDELRKEFACVHYPEHVLPIPTSESERIQGTAFFPGGDGLWKESPVTKYAMPIGNVMILGHNFSNKTYFDDCVKAKTEKLKIGTWRHLTMLLNDIKINLDMTDCFYTNFYIGLIDGNSSIGEFPRDEDGKYHQKCRQFFLKQLKILNPKVIFTLGTFVPSLIADTADKLGVWRNVKTFNEIDKEPLIEDVNFEGINGLSTTIVALTHPSQRPLNVSRRQFEGMHGHEAEVALINKALTVSKLRKQ